MVVTAEIAFSGAQYETLIRIIKRRTGMNLEGYRQGVAQRRIARRIRSAGFTSVEKYLGFLMSRNDEAPKLARAITIQVSQFFRNPDVFRVLGETVFPDVFSHKHSGEGVSVWSAGCAEGEEAYSAAILLLRKHSGSFNRHQPKVVGTDVNTESLEAARRGRYNDAKIELVDDSLKSRYFRLNNGLWEVRPIVRKLVEFRPENLFTGPGVEGADVILARNMLIYFDRERQETLFNNLAGCLRPGGFLVLGKSETLPGWMREKFRPVALRERVYQKII